MQQRLIPEDELGPPDGNDGSSDKGPKKVLTVTELTRMVKDVLSNEPRLRSVTVMGEVFEVSTPSSGHIYFTLKDEGATLSCIMWRSDASRLKFELEVGQKVLVKGGLNVYERQGRYQLHASSIKPKGKGELHVAFEQLRKKLDAEGLFAEERKRTIPRFPQKVGLVTSPTGAAIQDIIRVARERWPLTHIILASASVQGETAGREIVEGIGVLNRMEEVDVIIVGRGGGSLEDLWAFNEEVVARAIYTSKIPIVTGIGHEVDRTISDFVADRAAATPSQAAEMVFPDVAEISAQLERSIPLLASRLRNLLLRSRERYEFLSTSPALERPKELIDEHRQVLDDTTSSLVDAITHLVTANRHRLQLVEVNLGSLDPKAILSRGYSITTDEDGNVVKDAGKVDVGSQITVIVHKGELKGRVESRKEGEEDGEER